MIQNDSLMLQDREKFLINIKLPGQCKVKLILTVHKKKTGSANSSGNSII